MFSKNLNSYRQVKLEEDKDEDKTESEKQIIASAEYLETLISEGNEVV